MVFILPTLEVMAVSTEGHEVRNLVVSLVTVDVVYGHLAVVLRDESAAFTVVFLVGDPWALNVRLSHHVFRIATIVLLLIELLCVAFTDSNRRSTNRTIPHQNVVIDVGEGVS